MSISPAPIFLISAWARPANVALGRAETDVGEAARDGNSETASKSGAAAQPPKAAQNEPF
jgi:hypothetical protein